MFLTDDDADDADADDVSLMISVDSRVMMVVSANVSDG
jgi:hypothetical protein